eukprot:181958_1
MSSQLGDKNVLSPFFFFTYHHRHHLLTLRVCSGILHLLGRGVSYAALQGLNLVAEGLVLSLDGVELRLAGAAEGLLDELDGLIGLLGLLVEVDQHLGQGVDHVRLLEVLAELLLLGLAGLVGHAFSFC